VNKPALGCGARGVAGLSLDGAQGVVVGLLVLALGTHCVARRERNAALGAGVPRFDRLRNLRFNPGPTVWVFHVVEGYATKGRRVPSRVLMRQIANPQTNPQTMAG
jgi:hypothetical protein